MSAYLVNTRVLLPNHFRIEQNLWGEESLGPKLSYGQSPKQSPSFSGDTPTCITLPSGKRNSSHAPD